MQRLYNIKITAYTRPGEDIAYSPIVTVIEEGIGLEMHSDTPFENPSAAHQAGFMMITRDSIDQRPVHERRSDPIFTLK